MIESLLESPATRMLEQAVSFTEQRHAVISANIANASTPGYVQQDVSTGDFQRALGDALDRQRASNSRDFEPASNEGVEFFPGRGHVTVKPHNTTAGLAFHDRGVRSMESMMGDLADNAMAHNTVTQLLRNRYSDLQKAISMKV